jgi:hypothetical protein
MKKTTISKIAIHESGHFVYYLFNCIRQKRGTHHIKGLTVIPTNEFDGIFRHKPETNDNPEMVKGILENSEYCKNPDLVNNIKNKVRQNIEFILAGCCSELEVMRKKFPSRLESAIILVSIKKTNDGEKAVALKNAIGDPDNSLIEIYRNTAKTIKIFKEEILFVAHELDKLQIIEDEKLQELIEKVYSIINQKLSPMETPPYF